MTRLEDNRLLYGDQRTSTNALAASVPDPFAALRAVGTWAGGLIGAFLLAIVAILVGAPFDIVAGRIRAAWGQIVTAWRERRGTIVANAPDAATRRGRLLVRALGYLALGQVVVAFNAPLDALPPLSQFLEGVAFGATALLISHLYSKAPEIVLQRRISGHGGELVPVWSNVVLALVGVGIAHALDLVPGLVLGVVAIRRFRSSLDPDLTATSAWYANLLLLGGSLGAWFLLDLLGSAVPDPTAPVRVLGDGVLGMLVVAGSQGLLWTLVNPGERSSRVLRDRAFGRWLACLFGSAVMLAGILAVGGRRASLIDSGARATDVTRLAATAAASLVLLIAIRSLVRRREGLP